MRDRYFEVLRRFELWWRAQPPAVRDRLAEVPPEARMELVRERLTQSPGPPGDRLDPILARHSNLHPYPLFDQVYWIRSWFALDAEQRLAVQAATGDRRRDLLEQYGRENEIADDRPGLLQRFQRDMGERLQGRPPLGRLFEAMKPQAKEAFARRLQEARFLQDLRPEPVPASRLAQFTASLPGWMLESLDPLPPEAARTRLALLYRLAFPSPAEMPGISDAASTQPAPRSVPAQEAPGEAASPEPPPAAPF